MDTQHQKTGLNGSEEPLTEELLDELRAAPELETYLDQVATHRSLAEYLSELLETKELKRVDVVRGAGLNETFGYQIFMGTRQASRDNLLKLAFALGCTLREANRLLKAGGVNELYCKERRDAILIYALDHGMTRQEVDEALYSFGEETLGS